MIQTASDTIDEYNDSANIEMGQEGYITRILESLLQKKEIENLVFDYEEGIWTILIQDKYAGKREELATELLEEIKKLTGIQVRIYFSGNGSKMEELPNLYDQVKDLSNYSFYVGEGEIFGYGYNCKQQDLETVRQLDEKRSGNGRSKNRMTQAVQKGIELIENRYRENLSLDEICGEIAVSKTYFCYLFKRETGMSFWNYLTSVRLRHAKELLETSELRSYEVALLVGYDNPSYFSKLFKKCEGISPNEYRRLVISEQNIVAEEPAKP